jgi:hypothetical protein
MMPLSRYALIALSLLTACEKPAVTIRATVPRLDGTEAPVPDLQLVALPYDRDSVLQALESKGTPRPHTGELDSLFAAWRTPFLRFAEASYRSQTLRDSLARLRQRLDSMPRQAPEYPALYSRFGALTDSLTTAADSAEQARLKLDRLRKSVQPAIDSLRRLVSAWENSTFRDYDSIVERLAGSREPVAATTGPDGRATLTLEQGRWWIYAWAWDEGDPYSRWYWNVPVNGDSVILDARTGRKRPQY